jgi:ribosomal protein S18 acetylase RimI-like enzyme
MTIRKAIPTDHPSLGAIQLASWRTMFPESGIDASDYLAQFTLEEQSQDWYELLSEGSDIVYVAEVSGEIVGYGLGRISEDQQEGEIVSLHILPDHRGKGIGQKLIGTLANDFKQQGVTSIVLWVLKGNRARRLYERLGGALFAEQQQMTGKNDVALEITEVAYRWTDINGLCMS